MQRIVWNIWTTLVVFLFKTATITCTSLGIVQMRPRRHLLIFFIEKYSMKEYLNFYCCCRYFNRMREGFPNFNMMINHSKTETNIHDNSKHVTNFGRYQLDVKSFQLFSCYKSYQGVSIFHKSVFRSLASPGK